MMISKYMRYRNLTRPAGFLNDEEWIDDVRFRGKFIADFNHWLRGPSAHSDN